MSTSGQSTSEAGDYRLETIQQDLVWDRLVSESEQGNVFSSSAYLSSLGVSFSRYQVKNRLGETVAGAAVLEENGKMHRAPFPFTPHQGILFSEQLNRLPSHRRVKKKVEVTEFLIMQLIEQYGNFHMSLSPEFKDVRPFSWHNFNNLEAPRFSIKPRFTARLDLRGFELDTYLSSIRTVRKQEYRRSCAVVSESDAVDTFIDVYVKNFDRQQITLDDLMLERVRHIVQTSLNAGYGRLCAAKVDGHIASMTLFVHDRQCAWYLFGASDPTWRRSGASTALIINNLQHYAAKGIPRLDFVGINSPQRGDYKLSFNGQVTTYFEVGLQP